MGMIYLQWGIAALSFVVAAYLLVLIALDRRPDNLSLNALVAVEAALGVQFVWGVIRVLGDHPALSVITYLGYLVGVLLVLPIGVVWSSSERSRSGTAVLVVAVLLVPFLCLRLHHIWTGVA